MSTTGFLLERQLYLLILLCFLMAFRVPASDRLNIQLKISTLEIGCFSIKQTREHKLLRKILGVASSQNFPNINSCFLYHIAVYQVKTKRYVISFIFGETIGLVKSYNFHFDLVLLVCFLFT